MVKGHWTIKVKINFVLNNGQPKFIIDLNAMFANYFNFKPYYSNNLISPLQRPYYQYTIFDFFWWREIFFYI